MCGGSGGVVGSMSRLVSVIPTQLQGWLGRLCIGSGNWALCAGEETNKMSAAATNHSLEAKNRKNRKAFPCTVQIKLA